MLKTISVFFILIFLIPCKAQDTTKVPTDSLIIYKDSLGIFNDTLLTSDTTGLLTSNKNASMADTLVPLFSGPLTDRSYIISSKDIQFSTYRYTDDLLELYPFYYNKRYGSIGNSGYYLMGTPSVRYMQNGMPASNNADLNLIQSENIDSIEFIPAPRNNLYNYSQSSATINFITKDQLWLRPYTRIKYYQGADGEAMFDGTFNSVLYKKLYGHLDVTNRTFDGNYANTSFNSWQVTARLRYLFSNDLNVTASYCYTKLHKGLNGGINVDSTGIDNNDIIFNAFQAPVNYYLHDNDKKLHNFDLKFLAKPLENLFTDATIYYHFYQDNRNNILDNPESDDMYKSKSAGLLFRGYYDVKYYLNVNVNFQYEHEKQSYNTISLFRNETGNLANFSSVIDLHVSDIIKPSVFYKYSEDNNQLSYVSERMFRLTNADKYYQNCFGGDIKVIPVENIILYAGYSLSKFSLQNLNTFELTASWQLEKLYLRGDFINHEFEGITNYAFSGTLKFRLGSLLLESINIYDKNNIYNFREGVYFFDSLFVPNLLLKTGITLNIIGPRTYSRDMQNYIDLKTDYTFDFTLAGEIRKSATIYFTWENILDRQYYVVPFYPVQGRNLRFGVAWELLN